MYVYLLSESGSDGKLWTVGHFNGAGAWEPESDHHDREAAAIEVHLLNADESGTEERYTVVQSEPGLWTTGFNDPRTDTWRPDSDHTSRHEAEARARWLNGG